MYLKMGKQVDLKTAASGVRWGSYIEFGGKAEEHNRNPRGYEAGICTQVIKHIHMFDSGQGPDGMARSSQPWPS
jgi:hypothetical protein